MDGSTIVATGYDMDTANFATKGDIAEVKGDIAEVKGDIAEVRALIEKSETSLLTAFHKYVRRPNAGCSPLRL
jgi:hypothetical protein